MDELLETIVETLTNHGSAIKVLYLIAALNSLAIGALVTIIIVHMLR